MPYPNFPGLVFAVPHTGRPLPLEVHYARLNMAFPMNYTHMAPFIKGQAVDEARNNFADFARAYKARYIFFWDEDVSCPAHAIPELIYRMEHHPEAAVIGGVYCLKREPAEPLLFRGNGNGPYWDWKAGEFLEVSGIGMGCTLVRTEVFEDLKKPWFKTVFNYSGLLDATKGTEAWTEDLFFCKKVEDTGKWKVYADTSLLCGHHDMETGKEYRLPPDSKPVQHMMTPRGKLRILDLGSGPKPYESKEGSIIRADEEKWKPDYRSDLIRLPFNQDEFDILHSPALDRFPELVAKEVLAEWVRVLKPGGEMRLIVPDVVKAARKVAEGSIHPSTLYDGPRKHAYTADSLRDLLVEAGLEKIESVVADELHIAVRARKAAQ